MSDKKPLFHPILMHFAANYAGFSYREFASDYRVLVKSNLKYLEDFHADAVGLISDPYRETSAFGAEISFSEAIPLLFSMYLFVSVIPTIFIFDLVVRGGVAVWLFSLVGVSELAILSTVLSMWLLNFAFPAIWGSFYVVNYKLETR